MFKATISEPLDMNAKLGVQPIVINAGGGSIMGTVITAALGAAAAYFVPKFIDGFTRGYRAGEYEDEP